MKQMTVALFGVAIYLFCVHSFKLPIASVGIAIGLLGVLTSRNPVSFPPPLALMTAFLVWCAIGLPLSQFQGVVSATLVDNLKILLIFFVALNVSKSLAELSIFIGLWVLFFGLYPARGTFFNFASGAQSFGRYGWNFSFANYNDLAAYAILVLALSAFLLAGNYAKWIRAGALISTVLLALLIVITQSRGAFVGLVVAFLFMLFRSRRRGQLIRVGVLAALGISLFAPGAVWERISRMKFLTNRDTIIEADGSAEQRFTILQIAMTIARENALTGVGLGAYSDAHGRYAEERQEWAIGRGNRDAHNMYMSLAAETGVPGLAIFVGMLLIVLIRAQRSEKLLAIQSPRAAEQLRILRFGLIAYLLAAIFGSFHRPSFLYLYLAVLWSACDLLSTGRVNSGLKRHPVQQGRLVTRSLPVFRPKRLQVRNER